jgi:hypothetical protein
MATPYKLLQLALVVFGAVMLLLYPLAVVWVQSFGGGHHMGHLWGDVLALILVAVVLSALVLSAGLKKNEITA